MVDAQGLDENGLNASERRDCLLRALGAFEAFNTEDVTEERAADLAHLLNGNVSAEEILTTHRLEVELECAASKHH